MARPGYIMLENSAIMPGSSARENNYYAHETTYYAGIMLEENSIPIRTLPGWKYSNMKKWEVVTP